MVYTESLSYPSLVELARAGNFQAIAYWINQVLMPYGMRAAVGGVRPGCLKILVEFSLSPTQNELSDAWRSELVRCICHRIWKLNSAQIEGIRIAGKLAHEPSIRWEKAVRVISPARRARMQRSQHLRTQLRQASHRRSQLKLMRSMLISGPPIFAFIVGCVLGFSKAPTTETNAIASSSPPKPKSSPNPAFRPDTVQAALETVPVIKRDQVPDPNDPTVTLMFAGDVTLADHFADAIGQDYERTFANMDAYRKADIGMVNLENPLTRATIPLPDKKFNFKADPDSVKVLTSGGISLVNLANNHAMDYESPGLLETLDTLDKAGIEHVGAGRDVKAARRPEIIDVKGQRIAYFGYYGADFESAGDNTPGTNYADEQRIADDIKAVRNQVDWVIVNYHWGEELATHPADWQVNLAHFTIDQGADLVVGHHPHVLQGAEIYKGRPIAYSMGNFIFGGNPRRDYDTAVLKVALKDKQMKVEFVPVAVRGYQPKVMDGDQGAQVLNQIADLSSGFNQPMRSPIALDARPTAATEATATTPGAVTNTTPGEPLAEPSASPVSPGNTGSPANTAEPTPALTAPTGTTSPAGSPDESSNPAPVSRPRHSGFANSTKSFINSPSHTPLDSIQSMPNQFQSETPAAAPMVPASPTNSSSPAPEAPSSTPEPSTSDAAPPAPDSEHSSLPGRVLGYVPAANPSIAPTQPDLQSSTGNQSQARSQDTRIATKRDSHARTTRQHRDDWVASEQVGADLIPNVSLLAATAW